MKHQAPESEYFAAGTTINRRFEILGISERRAATVVYTARDAVSNKTVSMKALTLQSMQDSSNVKRLQQEARVLARLHHACIIGMIDFAVSETGRPFLVTDLLEGKRLSALMPKKDGWEFAEALPFLVQLSDAAAACADAAIVCRALRPAAVLVHTEENGEASLKLVDFDSAIFLDDPAELAMQLSPRLPPNDTPCYFSPEQFFRPRTDSRADVFSLACLFHEMLTGSAPFTAGDIRHAVEARGLPRPRKLSGLRSRGSLLPSLQKVLRQALAFDPADRFQSPGEFLDAVLFTTGSDSLLRLESMSEKLKTLIQEKRSGNSERT